MLLNKDEHRKIMLKVLSDISADSILAVNLAFKGGTACYFVYELDRFSIDLDFDLLDLEKQDKVLTLIDSILKKYGTVKMVGNVFSRKLKYNEESSSLKIDVSDRIDINQFNHYEVRDIVSGVPLKVLSKKDMFSHKLIALKDRYDNKEKNKRIANRDLYDINFFFKNDWKYNKEIIEDQVKKPVREYLIELRSFIEEKVNNEKILDGLGSLIDQKQRAWIKKNLKNEVLKQLAIEIEAIRG